MGSNLLSALHSIWGNKVRSVLTMLGVVIGVTSVTTLVAMGQGLKNDVTSLIEGLGTNIVAVLPGKIDTKGQSTGSPAAFIAQDILTPGDVTAIQGVDGVAGAIPLGLVPGSFRVGDTVMTPLLAGTYDHALDIMEVLRLKEGRMFTDEEQGVVVLAEKVATELFKDRPAIGQTVAAGLRELTVIGILEAKSQSSVFGSEFETIALVPFVEATALNKGKESISRIIVKAENAEAVSGVKSRVHELLLSRHNGEEDFTVLTQDDILDLFGQFLNLATAMVSAIAAISLIVGGIGIMNIMLVTVTERTREIGLRKAVGATKGAILLQFLIEAIIITLIGGLIGLGISVGIGALVAAQTPLTPAFTPSVIFTAFGISVVIGAVFGIWPAMRAARKDPIEALRYE